MTGTTPHEWNTPHAEKPESHTGKIRWLRTEFAMLVYNYLYERYLELRTDRTALHTELLFAAQQAQFVATSENSNIPDKDRAQKSLRHIESAAEYANIESEQLQQQIDTGLERDT